MARVMTILEATVPEEYWPQLEYRWAEMSANRPEQLEQSWLVQGMDGRDTWCAVAIWSSEEAFDEYRRSVDVPAAIKIFRSLDAEPELAAFAVVGQG